MKKERKIVRTIVMKARDLSRNVEFRLSHILCLCCILYQMVESDREIEGLSEKGQKGLRRGILDAAWGQFGFVDKSIIKNQIVVFWKELTDNLGELVRKSRKSSPGVSKLAEEAQILATRIQTLSRSLAPKSEE